MKDLQTSVNFYRNALNLKENERKEYPDAYMAYMTDGSFTLELRQFKKPIDFEVNRQVNHIAFYSEDFEGDFNRHKQMQCIERVLKDFGLYFIIDPDGHSIEIMRR